MPYSLYLFMNITKKEAEAVAHIYDYLIYDEHKDYLECGIPRPKNHIYCHLRSIKTLVGRVHNGRTKKRV